MNRKTTSMGDSHQIMRPSSPAMATEKLRLLIVDDHAVVREGLESMLSVHDCFERIQTAASAELALAACSSFIPHVILLDVRMPLMDGFETLSAIAAKWPLIRIVMLSSSSTVAEVKLAQRKGAHGYLSKIADHATLLEAVRTVAAGGSWFKKELSAEVSALPLLSGRELEVLQHLGRGLSSQDLGRVLGISAETIKSHLKSIFSKLGVADRAEAVARAYEVGLLKVG
jgi:DNA-binding NarL/FixJ family response regulator